MILIEEFNVFLILKLFLFINTNTKKITLINYLYSPVTILQKLLFSLTKFYLFFLNKKLILINFKMMDIRDINDMFSRTQIYEDIFELENKFLNENNLSEYNTPNYLSFKKYLIKRIFNDDLTSDKYSLTRTLFLVHVVNFFIFKKKIDYCNLFIVDRPFKSIIINYVNKIGKFKIHFSYRQKFKFRLKFFYQKLKYYIKKSNFLTNHTSIINNEIKIYCEGENHPNLNNDGTRSDFFWLFESKIPLKNVLYNCSNFIDFNILSKTKIQTSLNFTNFSDYDYKKILYENLKYSSLERIKLKEYSNDYNYLRNKYKGYFKTYNVKFSFCWNKYTSENIVINEILNEIGGISSVWQMAFDGIPQFSSRSMADIGFMYSKFSDFIEKKQGSEYKFQVITGYPISYPNNVIRSHASNIRNTLKSNGAEKIVCVFDENSYCHDERWHTGHYLQKENYEKILLQCLNNPKLGLIFKPKVSLTLKERLGGDIIKLLNEALETKRCFIYHDNDNYSVKKNKYSPLLAALSSDLAIHSHLSAGTAAIECALENIPTILIDREKILNSKLRDLPKNKIYFDNWDDAIYSINDYLFSDLKTDIGNWSNYLSMFDPYLDGKGSHRIGDYINNILVLFQKGYKKKDILEISSMTFAKKWGKDKIIIS